MTIVLIAMAAYLAAAGWLVADLGHDRARGLRPWWWLALAGFVMHGGRHL